MESRAGTVRSGRKPAKLDAVSLRFDGLSGKDSLPEVGSIGKLFCEASGTVESHGERLAGCVFQARLRAQLMGINGHLNIVSFRQACVSPSESGFPLGQEAADRGSAYFKPAGDLGFAAALLVQLSGFGGFVNHRWWTAEPFAPLACLR